MHEFPDRAVLYTESYVKSGYKPPAWLTRRLRMIFPFVWLDWHPGLERWCLWEREGQVLTFIAAIAGPNGEYQHPDLENTIGFLDRICVRGQINNNWDLERYLRELDRDGHDELELAARRRSEALIREGSSMLYDALRGRKVLRVLK